mmetsp:Transcript_13222/g.28965  ORF Transcript_13222/g.28965 Transcript_13222/m.28965 type:complete len:200 (-) Transcript_13222:398-997(-)
MHEDHHLLAPGQRRHHFVVGQLVHHVVALHALLLSHPQEGLVQGDGAVLGSEEEQSGPRVHVQEGAYVLVVGQGGGQTHDAHQLLRTLHVPVRSRHDGLQHRASLVRQQVHLVDDDQRHHSAQRAVPPLPGDHVVFLGRGYQQVRICDLLLGQLHVSRELLDHQSQGLESLRELRDHLLRQRLHGSDVDGLEGGPVDHS